MFPYDQAIVDAAQRVRLSIPEVLQGLQTIDRLCADQDGLKWFNRLYLTVTQAVGERVHTGGFADPAWLARLDVDFAGFYFRSLGCALSGAACPGCWQAMLSVRNDVRITRIQFALAGMNAHINHDLCQAIADTCRATNTVPQHGSVNYQDYSSVNAILAGLIEEAKQSLSVRLPGDELPDVSHLEDLTAGWDICAAREAAWQNAEHLWNLPKFLAGGLIDTIDGFTTVIGKTLLVPLP
jgi:hypothetical protein